MKWSVISVLVMACQVENPDSSTVQSGGDSSVEAVDITAKNSYATIKVTTDQPLKAGEEGTLRINFTANKNLQAKTIPVEQDGSGGENEGAEDQPTTYLQQPVMSLAYSYTAQPTIEVVDEENLYVNSSSKRRVTLNDMETGSSFTISYKVTAESTFFIEAKLNVAGEEEKFTFGSDDYYRQSKLPIEVDSPKTINPDDYATVEITKHTLDAKPTVRIKVTPKEDASKIETIVTKFRNTNYHSRKQAKCSGQGVNACDDGTTLTSAFATGNGITIDHPLTPKNEPNNATSATVEVKFILEDETEVVAGSEPLSWTTTEVETIIASAPAAASVQGGSSGVLRYSQNNFTDIASLQFLVTKPADRNDGLGLLQVVFNTYRLRQWEALKSGAELHLKLPFEHAYAGISNGQLVEHVKYDDQTATLYSNDRTGGRNWNSARHKKYEIKFKEIKGNKTVKLNFLVPTNIGSQQVRASMKIKDDRADTNFHRFGNSDSHQLDFTGICEWNKQASLRNDYLLIGTSDNAGNLEAQIADTNLMKVGFSSTILINNSANTYLADRDQKRDILVDVWGTARSDKVTYNVGNTIKTVNDSTDKTINNRHYDRYRLKPHNVITARGLKLKIPVRPSRDGREFSVRITNVKEGKNSGKLMAIFNFKVAPIPRRSCMYN